MAALHFTHAITRIPGKSMVAGISNANLGLPNYELACQQHANYVACLEQLGLEVTILPATEEYPDSCFVEDVALLTPEFAVLTNPGARSRNGEKSMMIGELEQRFARVYKIERGTLDGGDVMMVDNHFYVGLSERSNHAGIEELSAIMSQEGKTVSAVPMNEMLHLKTGVSYLENNLLLACGEFVSETQFKHLEQIEVPADQAYSANSLWINGTVIVPEGFHRVRDALVAKGVAVVELQMSEFEKLDGGLSCLSLRY